ncbi:MAG TPA: hypothetical protein VEZ89_11070 [Rubrivivax sp.]|nr:hypothetical protein [Rubrivivax sp.]
MGRRTSGIKPDHEEGGRSTSAPALLPAHLARTALFKLNTGARDDVVCNLRWDWEIRVPELGISVFEVRR